MTETVFVAPAHPAATIIDPASNERLPAGGAVKPRDPYWLGLLMRGDVVESEPLADDLPAEHRLPDAEANGEGRVAEADGIERVEAAELAGDTPKARSKRG